MLGFLAAATLLLAVGAGPDWVVHKLVGDVGLRAPGRLILAGGACILVSQQGESQLRTGKWHGFRFLRFWRS
jgi:hypothetical protein